MIPYSQTKNQGQIRIDPSLIAYQAHFKEDREIHQVMIWSLYSGIRPAMPLAVLLCTASLNLHLLLELSSWCMTELGRHNNGWQISSVIFKSNVSNSELEGTKMISSFGVHVLQISSNLPVIHRREHTNKCMPWAACKKKLCPDWCHYSDEALHKSLSHNVTSWCHDQTLKVPLGRCH